MNMETELRGTCHYGRVNDVVFPANCPSLFVTCSVHDIRIWNVKQRQELLRIQVYYYYIQLVLLCCNTVVCV
jgi:hypothetical protein